MEKKEEKYVLMDYCARGHPEMMQEHLDSIYSTMGPVDLETVTQPEKWKPQQVPSLFMVQIHKNFMPFVRFTCSPVRPMLSNETHYPPRGYQEYIFAPTCLAAEMVAQEFVLSAIGQEVVQVGGSPPLWFSKWRDVLKKVGGRTRIICESQQKNCTRISEEFSTLQKGIKDEKVMRCVAECYLRDYFHEWELSYAKLKNHMFDQLDILRTFQQDGEESTWDKNEDGFQTKTELRKNHLRRVEKFLSYKDEFYQFGIHDSPYYKQLLIGERREFLTIEFRVGLSEGMEWITLQKASEITSDTISKWVTKVGAMEYGLKKLECAIFEQLDVLIDGILTPTKEEGDPSSLKDPSPKEGDPLTEEGDPSPKEGDLLSLKDPSPKEGDPSSLKEDPSPKEENPSLLKEENPSPKEDPSPKEETT